MIYLMCEKKGVKFLQTDVSLLPGGSSGQSGEIGEKMAAATSLNFLLLLLLLDYGVASTQSDALVQLKKSIQNAEGPLSSWTNSTNSEPCTWQGVVCFNGIVTGLRLSNLGFTGTVDVDAIHQLPGLRSISFDGNRFSGPFPAFGRDSALKSLFLLGNRFSGTIPDDTFAKMTSLKKLWLSANNLSGPIPSSLTSLPHLMELRLENNSFSGRLPLFNLSSLQLFNVSNNRLNGTVPPEMAARFNANSFMGNPGLCFNETACLNHTSPPGEVVAAVNKSPPAKANHAGAGRTTLIVVTAVVVVVLCCFVMAALGRRHTEHVAPRENRESNLGGDKEKKAVPLPPVTTVPQGHPPRQDGGDDEEKPRSVVVPVGAPPELVLVQARSCGLSMTDLMKASAEVLGSGGLGSSYKAVIADGVAMVVKRMRDMNTKGKEEFHDQMHRLGGVRHPNVLPPVGYYYRKEEKLLVYDYASNGTLFFLLHGDRRPERPILEWPTRLRIAQGVAHGMAHLHTELADTDLPHGNLKSTNVLFREDCEPLVAEYGFSPLVNPTVASQNMVALRSPEFIQFRQVSKKSDVWCLGLLLLEIVTGQFPSQYLAHGQGGVDLPLWVRSVISEGRENDIYDPEIVQDEPVGVPSQMRQLLQIGLACTEPSFDKRPNMAMVQRRIEEIKIDERSVLSCPSLRDGSGDLRSSSRANMSAVFSSRRFPTEVFSASPP